MKNNMGFFGKVVSGTLIASMAFCITACGNEKKEVQEEPVVTVAAPAEESTANTTVKEAATETKEVEATEEVVEVKETEEPAAETEAAEETGVEEETEAVEEAAAEGVSPLVGEWKLEMFVFIFNEDGTGDYQIAGTSMPFTYEDHGNSVFVAFDGDDGGEEHGYRIEGNTLYFQDSMGEEVAYTR
jgi:hypothetical protein